MLCDTSDERFWRGSAAAAPRIAKSATNPDFDVIISAPAQLELRLPGTLHAPEKPLRFLMLQLRNRVEAAVLLRKQSKP